jgi:hypothetical protein
MGPDAEINSNWELTQKTKKEMSGAKSLINQVQHSNGRRSDA